MEHNIDPAEIAKFESLANRWWDRNSEFKPLHDINPLRMQFIEKYLSFTDKQVLDVGCGGGILSEAMAQRGAQVTGIDMGEAPLAVARLHLLESELDVSYEQTPVEQFARDHETSMDIVTCMEMLEHVPDPASVVASCAKILKPGGHLFVSTINRNPKAYLFAILGAEYLLKLLPKGTHEYEKFIKPSELSQFARDADLELLHSTGMTYNPFLKKYNLRQDMDVNYILHFQKPRG